MAERLIRIRYRGACSGCEQELEARTEAWWDGDAKRLRCRACAGDAEVEPAPKEAEGVELDRGVAGHSARRRHQSLHDNREGRIRARYPRLGGLILAATDDPQSTTAWAKGAEGERKVGLGLDSLAPKGVIALHDRRIPGTKTNVDHLAVSPSGVWVIDAKRYSGEVTKRDVGGWFKTDLRLFVGKRDCTKLVDAMARQVAAVRAALEPDWAELPVRPVLCFIDSQWSFFAKPFDLNGVTVIWPKAMNKRVAAPGPYGEEQVTAVATRLVDRLRAN